MAKRKMLSKRTRNRRSKQAHAAMDLLFSVALLVAKRINLSWEAHGQEVPSAFSSKKVLRKYLDKA